VVEERQRVGALVPGAASELVDLVSSLSPEELRQPEPVDGGPVDGKRLRPERHPEGVVAPGEADEEVGGPDARLGGEPDEASGALAAGRGGDDVDRVVERRDDGRELGSEALIPHARQVVTFPRRTVRAHRARPVSARARGPRPRAPHRGGHAERGPRLPPGALRGMAGLIKESEEIVKAQGDTAAKDAALIAAAQRVEHYEIAGYGTARALADELGFQEAESLLSHTLDEGKAGGKRVNPMATGRLMRSGVNEKAVR